MSVLIQPGSITDADESQIINTPEIRNAGTYQNAGTVKQSKSNVASGAGSGIGVATKQEQRLKIASGVGQGFGQATTNRFNNITASGAGLGLGTSIDTRFRDNIASGAGLGFGSASVAKGVSASGSGLGVGSASTDNFRDTSALGTGVGIGTARKPLPFDPVAQIIRLLEDTNNSCFRYDQPDRIDTIWEYSHNDRINFREAALYVYTPTDASIDKFSIDGDNFNQTLTIEVLVMTLDQQETSAYLRDLSRLIAQLYDDNTEESTLFHRFGNISAADLRNEHITQQSDHYIGTVTFEVQQFNTAATNCFE